MKTPKEWFEEELSGEPLTQESVIEVLKMVQEDAIEETVKLCAKNATFIITEDSIIEAGIETDYYSDGVFTTRICSGSILDCAEILKKEIE